MIYELRIYRALPGRMPDLLARFRDHTCRLFEKHGLKNVGYWTNLAGGRSDELWYIIAYEDLAQRERGFAGLAADPEWIEARENSTSNGQFIDHSENRMLLPTDFSPLQ